MLGTRASPRMGAVHKQGGDGQDGGDTGHQQLGEPGPHGIGQVVDVGRGPGEQVARPGPFDHAEGEVEDPGDQLLAQAGQDAFAENGAQSPAGSGEHGLDHQGAGEDDDGGVDPAGCTPTWRVLLMTSSSTFGPTRPAALATPWRASTTADGRRARKSRRRWRHEARPEATGRMPASTDRRRWTVGALTSSPLVTSRR
jgi:hypothetical protein